MDEEFAREDRITRQYAHPLTGFSLNSVSGPSN